MPSPYQGPHVLRLESGLKNPETVKTVSFRNDLAGSIEAVDLNLSHVLDLSEPEDLTWNRTSAIFLYPLARQPGQSFCFRAPATARLLPRACYRAPGPTIFDRVIDL
jgi:hypothetical protein